MNSINILLGILFLITLFYIDEQFTCNDCGKILKHNWVKNQYDCNNLCNGYGCTTGTWKDNNCTCE